MHYSHANLFPIFKILGLSLIACLVVFQLWFVFSRARQTITPSPDAQKVSTVELDSATFSVMAKRLESK